MGRRHEIPGSETKDFITHGIVNSVITSLMTLVSLSLSPTEVAPVGQTNVCTQCIAVWREF